MGRSLFLGLLVGLLCSGAFPEGAAPPRGSLLLELEEAAPGNLRLSLEASELRLVLRGAADEDGAQVRAGLDGPGFIAGPGAPAGLFRLAANPLASGWSSVLAVRPFSLDSSLMSSTALLGLQRGGLALLVSAHGGDAGLLAQGPAFSGQRGSEKGWQAGSVAALGLFSSCSLDLGLVASIGMDRGSSPGEAWVPDPPPEPARLSIGTGLMLQGGISGAKARLGIFSSFSSQAGLGTALRIEGTAKGSGGSLGVFLAAASPSFHGSLANLPGELMAAGLEYGSSPYRGASLRLRGRLSLGRPLEASIPPWDRLLGLDFRLPLGFRGEARFLGGAELERRAGESCLDAKAELRFSGPLTEGGSAVTARWVFSSEPEGPFPELGWTIKARARTSADGPVVDLALELKRGAPEAGTESPITAGIQVRLGVGLGEGGQLELEAVGEGMALASLPPDARSEGQEFRFSLSYRRSFGF